MVTYSKPSSLLAPCNLYNHGDNLNTNLTIYFPYLNVPLASHHIEGKIRSLYHGHDISPVSFLVISMLDPCTPSPLASYCSSNAPLSFLPQGLYFLFSLQTAFPQLVPQLAPCLNIHVSVCHFLRETSPDTVLIAFLSLCNPLPQCMFFKTFVTT